MDQPTFDHKDFYYGRRQTVAHNQTGQPIYTKTPLTPDDFLDPQPGDQFEQGEAHDRAVRRLRAIFRTLFRYNPAVTILTGVKLVWPVPGLAQPAPDLAVVSHLDDPHRQRPIFDVAREGKAPHLIVEVISPRFASQDLEEKAAIYAKAGIREYFTLNPGLRAQSDATAYTILGFRLQGEAYTAIAPDPQGRVHSETCSCWFGIRPDGQDFYVINARTGQEIEPAAEDDESVAAAQADAAFRAQSIASQLDFLR